MRKLWTLLAAMLLTVAVSGLTGCVEDEPTAEGMMKDVEKAASEVPKDHPAH